MPFHLSRSIPADNVGITFSFLRFLSSSICCSELFWICVFSYWLPVQSGICVWSHYLRPEDQHVSGRADLSSNLCECIVQRRYLFFVKLYFDNSMSITMKVSYMKSIINNMTFENVVCLICFIILCAKLHCMVLISII